MLIIAQHPILTSEALCSKEERERESEIWMNLCVSLVTRNICVLGVRRGRGDKERQMPRGMGAPFA